MDSGVIISQKRYKELMEAEVKLNALYAAGVDNWEGYSEAFGDDDDYWDDEDD